MLTGVRLERPKKVGSYIVGDVIGKGATGTVYKGVHEDTGEIVAIKVVSTLSIKEKMMKSIKKEMYLLKKLKHENIVKYIDFIQTDTHYSIVLEYIESGSLYGIIRKFGPFQESLVIIFVKQVLRGLEYLHRQGIVHRDIKGANILTTMNSTNGIIKLTDFGVATHVNDDDKGLTCVGTPYWMAPEAINEDSGGHITTSCDIWSLGCTIIELLTGNPPYSDGHQFAALFRMVTDPHPPFPEDISPECTDFLTQCFRKEPSERMDAKNLLKHVWMRTDIHSEVFDLINSPHPDLPEEVLNSIRFHINEASMVDIKQEDIQNPSGEQKPSFPIQLAAQVSTWEAKNEVEEQKEASMFMINGLVQNPLTQSVQGSLKNIAGKDQRLVGLKLNSAEHPITRNTLGEEGSFMGSMVENSRPLDSLRNYNFKKKNTALTLNSKREQKMFQDTQEIVNGLSKIKESKKAEEYMSYLSDICLRYPKAKNYFIQQSGLTLFLDLLDRFSENHSLILSVLSFLNQITDQDIYFLELACLFGVVPAILKFTSELFSREIRCEASNFIGQLLIHPATLQIFLACGGCSSVADLLDMDFTNNKEIISIGMDMLAIILESSVLSRHNLCRMLCKHDICARLSLIFYGALEDQCSKTETNKPSINNQEKINFLSKSLDLLLIFAGCDDKPTKMSICEDETIQILTESLEVLSGQEDAFVSLKKTVLLFRYLSNEHNLLNKLENFGVIRQVLLLLSQQSKQNTIDEDFLEDLLKIINYFQNLSHPRQEQLALLGALPILISITESNKVPVHLRMISLTILCHFVKTSVLTRKKLVELGGPYIFLKFLQESEESLKAFSFKILDTLASWLEIDFELLQAFFLENIHFFIPLSNSTSVYLLQIIPIINRIISLSDGIAQEMAMYDKFVESLCCLLTDFEEKNGQNANTPQIKMKILEILFCILIRSHPNQVCQIFEVHGLKQKLLFIIEKAAQLDIIILQEISENLLSLYNDSKMQQSNNYMNSSSNIVNRNSNNNNNNSNNLSDFTPQQVLNGNNVNTNLGSNKQMVAVSSNNQFTSNQLSISNKPSNSGININSNNNTSVFLASNSSNNIIPSSNPNQFQNIMSRSSNNLPSTFIPKTKVVDQLNQAVYSQPNQIMVPKQSDTSSSQAFNQLSKINSNSQNLIPSGSSNTNNNNLSAPLIALSNQSSNKPQQSMITPNTPLNSKPNAFVSTPQFSNTSQNQGNYQSYQNNQKQ